MIEQKYNLALSRLFDVKDAKQCLRYLSTSYWYFMPILSKLQCDLKYNFATRFQTCVKVGFNNLPNSPVGTEKSEGRILNF